MNNILHISMLLLSVLIACFSQLFLKKEALKEHPTFLSQYLNLLVIMAYILMLISNICSLIAFRKVPLAISPIADATSQIITVALSAIFLKEKITKKKLLGLLIIVIGIVVLAV